MKKSRLWFAGSVVAFVSAAIFLPPLPYTVRSEAIVQLGDADSVYVEAAGSLTALHARIGEKVVAGQSLVTLENTDMDMTIARLEGERRLRQARIQAVQQRALAGDDQAAGEINLLRESLAVLEQQITQVERDSQRLQVISPRGGTIMPASYRQPTSADSRQLATWHSTALDERNRGAFLSTGTLVCRVGDPQNIKVLLAIDQTEIPFVRVGQVAAITFPSLPGVLVKGTISTVANEAMTSVPLSLSSKAQGGVPTATDDDGLERPLSPTYAAEIRLHTRDGVFLSGATGQAAIRADRQSLAQRIWRFACQTFRLEM